jgi:hypothetical protein
VHWVWYANASERLHKLTFLVGKCCQGKPGHVWLLEEDIVNMSKHLKIPRDEFIAQVFVPCDPSANLTVFLVHSLHS